MSARLNCYHAVMRTTVTLEAETERLLRQAMTERGMSFKAALNDAIRRGLADIVGEDEAPFVVHASDLGLRPGFDPGRLNALADELEADEYTALTQRAPS